MLLEEVSVLRFHMGIQSEYCHISNYQAGVDDAAAQARVDRTNLAKAAIRSPIDGVVLTRAVEPGNAVAASLQAVTLLTLAEDLQRLKLTVKVDEADVGQVLAGQSASFTVSSAPSRSTCLGLV